MRTTETAGTQAANMPSPDRLRERLARQSETLRWPQRGVIPDLGSPRMAPSSHVSRPSPSGGLRPALTPAPGGANGQRSRAGTKEDQQTKIRLPEVSGEHHDAEPAHNTLAMALLPSPYLLKGDVSTLRGKPNAHGEPGRAQISVFAVATTTRSRFDVGGSRRMHGKA